MDDSVILLDADMSLPCAIDANLNPASEPCWQLLRSFLSVLLRHIASL